VLGDDGRTYVSDAISDVVLGRLCTQADWLTPNLFELGLMAGRPLEGLTQARDAAKSFGKPVLVSSIRTALGLGNLLAAPTGDWFCETARLPRAPKGAGDLLSALYVGRRVRGDALAVALEGATGAVFGAVVTRSPRRCSRRARRARRSLSHRSASRWRGAVPCRRRVR